MKGKKEIAILFFIIAVLAFYISSRKSEKTHYELPEVSQIQAHEISKINIKKKSLQTVLVREGDTWLIGDRKYPADSTMVDNMLKAISGLTLTALVSESENYAIYELDENGRVEVEVFKEERLVRKISIGKNTPTHHQTFVMLDDDPRVYHAKGTIRREFDRTVSELRDKRVLSFTDEISEIVLKKGAEEIVIVRTAAPVSVDVSGAEKGGAAPEDAGPKWKTSDGRAVKDSEIDQLVNMLSSLQCDDYIEGRTKDEFVSPVFTATLKGAGTYTIALFEKEEDRYPAVSSGSEYAFLLSEWKTNKINRDPGTLLEEEK